MGTRDLPSRDGTVKFLVVAVSLNCVKLLTTVDSSFSSTVATIEVDNDARVSSTFAGTIMGMDSEECWS